MVLQSVLKVLLPRRCPGCQGQLGHLDGLCAPCRSSLYAQLQSHSPLSGQVTPHLVVLGPYRGVLGRSVRALKYGHSRDLAGVLGTRLAQGVPAWWGVQAVTAVPLHPERLRERGFNQAELLGRQVAGMLGLPYLNALSRNRATGNQAKRHAKDRLGALDGAFLAQPGLPETMLLLDDVMTTGTTLLACAGALRAAGVRQVYFATVAR
ncbi:ComF family protein [Deinococcus sp.]|uniref:ComF family protein n=1 Tax=Deinococcus sp. TaxID=47478 RepID=UPI003C7D4DC5